MDPTSNLTKKKNKPLLRSMVLSNTAGMGGKAVSTATQRNHMTL